LEIAGKKYEEEEEKKEDKPALAIKM